VPGTRGQGGHGGEGLEVGDFRAPHLAGHLARGVVNHGVTGPVQPTDRLLVQVLDGAVRPVQQEVSLDVLDQVFNLPLALGIARAAEDRLEGAVLQVTAEDVREAVIAQVLVAEENAVLVVDDEPGNPVEEAESELMGVHGVLAAEGSFLEPNELVPAVAQQHPHEVNAHACAVATALLAGAEVNLRVLARWRLGKARVLALVDVYLGQVVFLAQLHDVIVDGLGGHLGEGGVMFLQPVVHLRRGRVLELAKAFKDEGLVGIKQAAAVVQALGVLLELGRVHAQVLLDGSKVNAQVPGYPANGFALLVMEPVNFVVHDQTV